MIIFLSSLQFGSGNKHTIERIRSYFSDKYDSTLFDVNSFKTSKEFFRHAKHLNTKLVIGLHLYRAGKLLIDGDIPFIIIIGGTDINQSILAENEIKRMCLQKAKYCVAFSDILKKKLIQFEKNIDPDKIIVQPQGVLVSLNDLSKTLSDISGATQTVVKQFIKRINNVDIKNLKIFLFVGGIRPVKDPLYLVETFSRWHSKDQNIHFVIVGPEIDEEYGEKCKNTIKGLEGVWLFPLLPLEDVHCLMRHSFSLVNSSVNEGMAAAILEAMAIGLPVLARRNDSNAQLITDGVNGMLFGNVEEFREKAFQLMENATVRENVIVNGRLHIRNHHNYAHEQSSYLNLVQTICPPLN